MAAVPRSAASRRALPASCSALGQRDHAIGGRADPHGEPDPGAVGLQDRQRPADLGREQVRGRGAVIRAAQASAGAGSPGEGTSTTISSPSGATRAPSASGIDQFPGQVAAPAIGVRSGHPVRLRAHRGDQVASVRRQPGRAHQRGDLGRRGAVAIPGREHGDDRLGQLAVPGAGGIEPGPLERHVRGQFGHGLPKLVRPVLLAPRAGQEPAGDPRLAAHPEQRVLPAAGPRRAHLGDGGQPVRLEVLARQPERQRRGQGRPGPAHDPAQPGQQPEGETRHIEQVPYPHGITSRGEAFPRTLTGHWLAKATNRLSQVIRDSADGRLPGVSPGLIGCPHDEPEPAGARDPQLLQRGSGAMPPSGTSSRAARRRRSRSRSPSGRPYRDPAALLAAVDAAFDALSWDDIVESMNEHPRIGDRTASTAMSAAEQSGAAAASDEVRQGLADGNVAYEQRFGHIFLICASGLSGQEMLDQAAGQARERSRMPNGPWCVPSC